GGISFFVWLFIFFGSSALCPESGRGCRTRRKNPMTGNVRLLLLQVLARTLARFPKNRERDNNTLKGKKSPLPPFFKGGQGGLLQPLPCKAYLGNQLHKNRMNQKGCLQQTRRHLLRRIPGFSS
ncbi:MAG: hypothetical protein KKA60_08825, partial [Proteobacteria bacterium]|nr:hypothetical protein [Pseudomonadota bacterium]